MSASPGKGLIAWFIHNPVAANLLMIVLLVGGALSASQLQSQVFPTISPGTVTVTVLSNADVADQMEQPLIFQSIARILPGRPVMVRPDRAGRLFRDPAAAALGRLVRPSAT